MTDNFTMGSQGGDEESPLSRTSRPASKAYKWRSRITAWKARLKSLLAWLKTKAGASASAALLGGGALGTVAIINPGLVNIGHGVEAPVQRWGEAVVFPIDGVDLAGRKASFDLVLMPKDYTWVLASSTELAHNGVAMSEAEVADKVFSQEVRDGLGHSPEVIAVGVASQEGDLDGERERAERRARTQAQLIGKAVSPLTRIWALNLGRYSEACNTSSTADTSWQRPVMMVGVRLQQPGVVLAQALENAISGKSNVPSRECYSSFDMVQN